MENSSRQKASMNDIEPRIISFFQKNWLYVKALLLAFFGFYLVWQAREVLFSLIVFTAGLACLAGAAYSLGLSRIRSAWIAVYNSFKS